MAAMFFGEKCHYCQKWRSPHDISHLPGDVKICESCQHRHLEALAILSKGVPTGECSECGRKAEGLTSMAVHFENGLYRAMCMECDAVYVRKRKELYGETEFGRNLKLT
jgi:hypothetical protein